MPVENVEVRVPLPSYLTPEVVMDALRTYVPLIVASPYYKSHERMPVDVAALVADPFFRDDGRKLESFEVVQRISMIPGLDNSWTTRDVTIPCVFQAFENEVQCRATAMGGVIIRSVYGVRLRQPEGGGGGHNDDHAVSPGAGDYEIYERAAVDAGTIMKTFVMARFQESHLEILQRTVDEIVRTHGIQHSMPTIHHT